jgi:hypothetical protein
VTMRAAVRGARLRVAPAKDRAISQHDGRG